MSQDLAEAIAAPIEITITYGGYEKYLKDEAKFLECLTILNERVKEAKK